MLLHDCTAECCGASAVYHASWFLLVRTLSRSALGFSLNGIYPNTRGSDHVRVASIEGFLNSGVGR